MAFVASVPITSSASKRCVGEDRHAERLARLVDPRDLLGEIVGIGARLAL